MDLSQAILNKIWDMVDITEKICKKMCFYLPFIDFVLSKICSIEYILTSHFMLRWKINYQSKLSYIFSKASALITVYHPLQKLPWKR